jgi:hypothetical protein
MNPVHTTPSFFSKIHLNIILAYIYVFLVLSSGFPPNLYIHGSSMRATWPAYLILLDLIFWDQALAVSNEPRLVEPALNDNWQGETNVVGEKRAPVPFRPPQIPILTILGFGQNLHREKPSTKQPSELWHGLTRIAVYSSEHAVSMFSALCLGKKSCLLH